MLRRALVLVLVLVACEAMAAPAPEGDRSRFVIPPGREAAARDMLATVVADTAAPYDFRGPTIEFERIQWWLLRDGEALGMLLLMPRERAEPGDATSRSFAIRETWVPDHEPSAFESGRMQAARDAVIAGDHGQFYVYRFDVFEAEVDAEPPPYARPAQGDSSSIRRRWALEFAGVVSLGLVALAITLRRRP